MFTLYFFDLYRSLLVIFCHCDLEFEVMTSDGHVNDQIYTTDMFILNILCLLCNILNIDIDDTDGSYTQLYM